MARRKPLTPIDWTPEDIEAMASDPDLMRGLVWWQGHGRVRYRNLPLALNADDYEDNLYDAANKVKKSKVQKSLLGAGALLLWWRGRYYTQAGTVVSRPRIWDATRRAVSIGSSEMSGLCNSLKSGTVSLAEWQLQMADKIIASHVGASIIAGGGVDALAPDILAYVEEQINFQLTRLGRLANLIASGEQRVDGTVCRLMKMYGNSPNSTFWGTDNIVVGNMGYTLYMNELGANEDHCTGGRSCQSVTAEGLQPVGSLTPIGSRTCLSNCLCSWRYYNPTTGEWW